VVEDAVKKLAMAEEGRELTGYGMDFAVMRTAEGEVTGLIEVNDGYSLGHYEGL